MTREEIKAIQNCQAGNLQEFGQLYDLYVKKIYAFIYAKTGHRETAEDLVSQTFFKALQGISKFKLEQGTFQSWIYTIARNLVTDYYRSQKSDIRIDDCWDLPDKKYLDFDFDTSARLLEVEQYLVKLKVEQRDIIIMRIWHEMSYHEIADVLGKTESACKMSFSRAIKDLRRVMPLAMWIFLIQNLKI